MSIMEELFKCFDKNMETLKCNWLPELNATLEQFEEFFHTARANIDHFKRTGRFEIPQGMPDVDFSNTFKKRLTVLMSPPVKRVPRGERQKIKTEKVDTDIKNVKMEKVESIQNLNPKIKQEPVPKLATGEFTRLTRSCAKRLTEQQKDDECVILEPYIETVDVSDSIDNLSLHYQGNEQAGSSNSNLKEVGESAQGMRLTRSMLRKQREQQVTDEQKIKNVKPTISTTTPPTIPKFVTEMEHTKIKPPMTSSSVKKNINIKKATVATVPVVTKGLSHLKESTQKEKDEKLKNIQEKLIKTEQFRPVLLKQTTIKKTVKDRQPKFGKDQLEEIIEINEERALADETFVLEPHQGSVKPVYLTQPLPLLPTPDCYDSDDERGCHLKCIFPSWVREKDVVLNYKNSDNTYIGMALFPDAEQTPDLRELFSVVDSHKLKRTSSAHWNDPPHRPK